MEKFKLGNYLRLSMVFFILLIIVVLMFLIPNPLGSYVISEAKAKGYIEYKPMEAHDLANKICTQCHTLERIKKYCPRCGPPFVAVVPHMQTFIENYRETRPEIEIINITEHQAVAIVQVWNALIGNWEGDFREQDILKLIGQYHLLAELYKTPVEERKIEWALNRKDELKMGYESEMPELQKNLGKPENNPCASNLQEMQKDHDKLGNNPCAPQEHVEHKQHEDEEHKH